MIVLKHKDFIFHLNRRKFTHVKESVIFYLPTAQSLACLLMTQYGSQNFFQPLSLCSNLDKSREDQMTLLTFTGFPNSQRGFAVGHNFVSNTKKMKRINID